MEAVPKIPLISFELKVSPENTHFGPKLKQYITEVYREDGESYNNEMHQLEGLRSAAIRASSDTIGLTALIRYFCQLRVMQSRFLMSKGQPAACSFTWKDLYANMNSNISDVRFEMACILYNIGALHTQLGASEPRNSPESLKAACTHYQNAAWAFQHLQEHYPQPTGMDVSTEIMRLLQEICFAQAQECVLDKSIQDTRKSSTIGAVATQVFSFYKNALAILGPSTGTDNIHEIIGTRLYNYWHRYLSFKSHYIGCIVALYQGINAEEQQKMGERVAFFQLAADRLTEARKLAKHIEPTQITLEALTFTNDVVEGKRKAAKNENEFIYHEKVPEKDILSDFKPVCLVKALPINFNDPEVSGPDIFSRLVPMGAHEASSMYSEEKAKLLRQVVNQAEAKTTELTEFMSSLQLDQLDILDSEQRIPQEIVDRCAAMNAKSEIIQTLVDSMNNLAEVISDVEHSLEEIKQLIQQETQQEKEYQKVMGPRPPSIVQTELSREYHKYQEAHARTNESNQVLHKAMTLHIANLRLLAMPLDALQQKIPSLDNIEGLDRDTMKEMRRVVGKARQMHAQRDALVQQLREDITNDDITSVLLANNSQSHDEIFKKEIDKHTPKVKIIEQNLSAQENVINRMTTLYASYGESRRLLSDVLRKREGLINALITSYDSYEELLTKAQKGLEFYKKLTHNVTQLLTRLRSTCQVQEEERQQLLAKHTSKAVAPLNVPTPSKPAEVTPSIPGDKPKLKDYLPYMKNRGLARSVTPQAYPTQPDPVLADNYYPDNIYPTSIRPAPVGSEATDVTQMQLSDGIVASPSMQNPHLQHSLNTYNVMSNPYSQSENIPYSVPNDYYASISKGYEKPESNKYDYSAPYNQYSSQISNTTYTHPYYSGSSSANTTTVTDSQNVAYTTANQSHINPPNAGQYSIYGSSNQANVLNPNEYNPYHSYTTQYQTQPLPATSTSGYSSGNPTNLNETFAQMHVSEPKIDSSLTQDYSHTHYSVQQPQASTQNMTTYSHAGLIPDTNMVSSQNDSSTYGYGEQHTNLSTTFNVPNMKLPFSSSTVYDATSQGYPVYTNTDSNNYSATSVTNIVPSNVGLPYNFAFESDKPIDPLALAQLDAMDKPIKSHVTGEALSSNIYTNYQGVISAYSQGNEMSSSLQPQNYQAENLQSQIPLSQNIQAAGASDLNDQCPNTIQNQNAQNQTMHSQNVLTQNMPSQNQQNQDSMSQSNQPQTVDSTSYPYAQQTNVNYVQTYQNHPGFSFNNATGGYEYDYGSQNSCAMSYVQENLGLSENKQESWVAAKAYTNAGTCETFQSPSEALQMPYPSMEESNTYYNVPYGYQTNVIETNENPTTSVEFSTNYGAGINQSTYMQSGQVQDTSVTFSKDNRVPTSAQNLKEPQNIPQDANVTEDETISDRVTSPKSPDCENETEILTSKVEPTTFDLLSDIDFSIDHKPLMPDIKVPQISETAIIKAPVTKLEKIVKEEPKEEVIERPAKRDLFSDPSLLNKFTQEVKDLQRVVDTLTNKTVSGLTVLDSKWKYLQDIQTKENMIKSKSFAMKHTSGRLVCEVVPYDETRLMIKSDRDAYINASYCKQLTSWCIPLVIAKNPSSQEYDRFWRGMLENKISCIVCLLGEIEVQGSTYWPTAKGQSLQFSGCLTVTLEEVKCTVHWTERSLTMTQGKVSSKIIHYQINVYPAKIVCPPLVLLADRILSLTYENRLSNQLMGACIQCSTGAGRSSVLALLLATMCQVRAGQLPLCGMLDECFVELYKHRTNVLEETKYIADAYRTVLFYVQGVLCSGTVMFNGEAVAVPSSTSLLTPRIPQPPPASDSVSSPTQENKKQNKFTRESFEEMRQAPRLKSGDMKDPLNFLDPLWNLKKK